MANRKFYSELFGRYILPDEVDYNSFVRAELLFRIDKMKDENCSCMKCKDDLKKFKDYFQNLKILKNIDY